MTDPRLISIEAFDYPLPDGLIARHPLAVRDTCRLLVRHGDGSLEERVFADIAQLLSSDDMLVMNNTKVINARLRFRKGGGDQGARIEVFCLEPVAPADYERSFASRIGCSWRCFVGNSKKWKEGSVTMNVDVAGEGTVVLTARRLRHEGASSVIGFEWDNDSVTFSQIIEAAGELPIPPYLNRDTEESDLTDYQTVYSRIQGSVAAPTAGLHFTPALFESLRQRGVELRELTLHVGAGTFQPVKSETIGGHPMHSEFISVGIGLIEELARTDRRVVAVGTTSVRTLESLYWLGVRASRGESLDELPQWYSYDGHPTAMSRKEAMGCLLDRLRKDGSDVLTADTRIIIAPGYRYRVVEAMVTNFHQPKSTLLLLVSAFTGGDWRRMYDLAMEREFRFLSYGDACLLL